MLKNYIKVALRNLFKNRSYVLINTFGLGIALACCLSAYLLLAFNIEFDNHFSGDKIDRTFRMHTFLQNEEQGPGQMINCPINMGPSIADEIPGVEYWSRYQFDGGYVRYGDNSFSEPVAFADEDFFDIFDLELLKGDFQSFKKVNTVVLSKRTAEKYFNKSNPIGEVLTFNFANQKEIQAVVGAVFENVPLNSSLVFDIMLRTEHFQDIYSISNTEWGDWRDPTLFVTLQNPDIAADASPLFKKYVEIRNEAKKDMNVTHYELHPFLEAASQDDIWWSQINLRISTVPLIIFSVMALMILLIACFNLTNTTIAITAKRFKEIGIRKVSGATKRHVISQFLLEMVISIFLAMVAGVIVSRFVVPEFADMWGLTYGLSDLNGLNFIFTLLILIFVSALLAGLYPAMLNSSYEPVKLIKGGTNQKGINTFSRVLVALQFAISVIVLVNGIVFANNSKFQESLSYGYNIEKIVTVNVQDKNEFDVLKSKAQQNPLIQEIGLTNHQLGASSYRNPIKYDTSEFQVQHIEVGENFFETMEMKLKLGRFLDTRKASEKYSIVVNERMVQELDLTDPINEKIEIREEDYRIVGVVENHVDNLFRSKEPEAFVFYPSKPNEYKMMLVKTHEDNITKVRDDLEKVWKEEFPEKPFVGRFQEDLSFGGVMQVNTNLKKIFIFLTILGGLLSASGIFALASLNVRKRTKEIGIRKALGATVSQIVTLLSRSFVILLSIACIVGAVGGFFLSDIMLSQIYAYHVEVGLIPLLVSFLIISSIGVFTTGMIIYNAARANPVLSLRDE